MLKINILPPSGGDTHWINTYDVSFATGMGLDWPC